MNFKDLMKKLMYSFHLITHPFDGFWDIKYEKRGSVGAATVILLLAVLTKIISRQYMGYIFNTNELEDLSIFNEFIGIVLPFLLWCIGNWCLTTLFDGEGTFRDIYIYSAYALVPYVLITIPVVFLSNYIVLEEATLLFAFSKFALIWSGFLFFIGTITVHQYTATKSFLIMLCIAVGMGVILFMGILFFVLIQQLINFVLSVIKELTLRIA